MLYTPKYIYNNDLDKKICKCAEKIQNIILSYEYG